MITFIKRHWFTVTLGEDKARLCVRQPSAIEGVRYQSIVKQLVADNAERDEELLRTHVDLLVAVIVDAEEWATPFPVEGTENDRRKWIEQLPFHVIGQLAPQAFRIGLVPFSVE